MSAYFTSNNAKGYSSYDLCVLNVAFEALTEINPSIDCKSVAETILSNWISGMACSDLIYICKFDQNIS